MTHLTTLVRCNGFYRAFFSDDTSLIIHESDALGLSKAYNIRIEDEDVQASNDDWWKTKDSKTSKRLLKEQQDLEYEAAALNEMIDQQGRDAIENESGLS